jgi:hypothetical protein
MARPKTKKIVSAASPINEELSAYGRGFQTVVAAFDDGAMINQVRASVNSPSTSMRQNTATSITQIAKYAPIYESACSPYPFGYGDAYAGSGIGGTGNGYGGWGIWITQAINLMQAGYTFITKLRQTIDLHVQLCTGNIILRGGTAQSRSFFEKWLKKINYKNLQAQFYLEYNRSGNCFFYKLNSTLDKNTVKIFNEAFGAEVTSGKKLPIKYLLLNPAWVGLYGGTTFITPSYYKILNQYEIAALFRDSSPENIAMIEKVPELKQFAQAIKNKRNPNNPGSMGVVQLPLSPEHLVTIFQSKTDYEGMAIPKYFGLIELFSQRIELRRIDLAINRQILRATLLITAGSEEAGAPSVKQIAAIQSLFTSDSISSVIVGDYTIKGEWLVPDVGDLFDPQKYTALDNEIDSGLGNVLFGDAKMSSAVIKLDVFVEKLKYDRQVFLDSFLIPQMESIAREFGFKDIPTPEYEPINIREQATRERIFVQLAQLGILTADEVVTALNSGVLPDSKESVVDQTAYKALRDKELYQPLLGKPQENDGGRPTGSSSPQTTKKPKPVGNVGASQRATPESLKDTVMAATKLEKKLEIAVKKQYNIKKLSKEQSELVGSVVEQIVINEPKVEWEDKVATYLDFKQKIENTEVYAKVDNLARNFELNPYAAAILYHSLVDVEEVKE